MCIWCKYKETFMSGFNVVRAENGQIRFTLKNVENFDVGGVAKVTGDATFSVGRTDKNSDETVLQMGATKDTPTVLDIDDDLNNIELYGSNLEAKFNAKTDKQYNVQWSATNSTLDSRKGEGSLMINTHEKSENNTFKLGKAKTAQALYDDKKADNLIVDNGNNNTFISSDNSANYFETTEKSVGANMFGGNGENTFLVNGKRGFIVGGSADDLIVTGQKSKGNVLAGMDGNDRIEDYGDSNLTLGGKGKDSMLINGENGLANLGFGEDYTAVVGKGAENNALFTGEKITSSNLTTYNYKEYLAQYLEKNGMTEAEFMARAGLKSDATAYDIIAALKG